MITVRQRFLNRILNLIKSYKNMTNSDIKEGDYKFCNLNIKVKKFKLLYWCFTLQKNEMAGSRCSYIRKHICKFL